MIAVTTSDGSGQILIASRNGAAIRFDETDVRPMGRTAYGVRGLTLRDDDEVVAMEVLRPGTAVLTLTENGFGKRTPIDDYRVTARGGVGIINIQTTERNGRVVGVASVAESDEVMFITQQGKVLRTSAGAISMIGRNTQGVRLIDMEPEDKAVSLARLDEQEGQENGDGDATFPVSDGNPSSPPADGEESDPKDQQ